MDFELKGDKNKVHFEAFGTSHSIFVSFGYLVIFFGICSVIVVDYMEKKKLKKIIVAEPVE